MNCDSLAATGATAQLLVYGAVLVGIGIVFVGFARARHRRHAIGSTALALIVLVGAANFCMPVMAYASTTNCVVNTPTHPLVVVQTSVLDGLAPDVAPSPIVGRITNTGTQAVIEDVTVSIFRVDKYPGARAGSCDSSDYTLNNALMLVGVTLPPGASVTFTGASIGFGTNLINQDACQGATVVLRYDVRSSGG